MSDLNVLIDQFFLQHNLHRKVSTASQVIESIACLATMIRATKPATQDIVEVLSAAIEKADWQRCELALIAVHCAPSVEILPCLSKILALQNPDAPNENVVEALAEIGTNQSVDLLKKAMMFRFKSDSSRQIPQKAQNALYEIGTFEAINVLRHSANDPDLLVRDNGCRLLSLLE